MRGIGKSKVKVIDNSMFIGSGIDKSMQKNNIKIGDELLITPFVNNAVIFQEKKDANPYFIYRHNLEFLNNNEKS